MAAEELMFRLEVELYRLNSQNVPFWTPPASLEVGIQTTEAGFVHDVENQLKYWALKYARKEEAISRIDAARATLYFSYEENNGSYEITYKFLINRPKKGWDE